MGNVDGLGHPVKSRVVAHTLTKTRGKDHQRI